MYEDVTFLIKHSGILNKAKQDRKLLGRHTRQETWRWVP